MDKFLRKVIKMCAEDLIAFKLGVFEGDTTKPYGRFIKELNNEN
jgi:hypothetical protein